VLLISNKKVKCYHTIDAQPSSGQFCFIWPSQSSLCYFTHFLTLTIYAKASQKFYQSDNDASLTLPLAHLLPTKNSSSFSVQSQLGQDANYTMQQRVRPTEHCNYAAVVASRRHRAHYRMNVIIHKTGSIYQCCQSHGKPKQRPQATCSENFLKFTVAWVVREIRSHSATQTDICTDTSLITLLRSHTGGQQSKNTKIITVAPDLLELKSHITRKMVVTNMHTYITAVLKKLEMRGKV